MIQLIPLIPLSTLRPSTGKKVLLLFLALGASTCLVDLSRAIWLRLETRWYVRELSSSDPSRVQRAFSALVHERSPEVTYLLCDEVDNAPSKEVHFQIARILHVRCGLPFLWESWDPMPGEDLRRMVREKLTRRGGEGYP